MLDSVKLVVDGSPMEMLVARPDGDGPFPGLLLSHYQRSLGPFTRLNAEMLAREGFVVVAPDHYHHTPDETDLARKKDAMLDMRIIADMRAATDYLRAMSMVDPKRTGIIGHCMGGRHALLGCATIEDFRCGIDCYGGGVMRARGEGPTVFERLPNIRCPIAGFFGADDNNPPVADVRKVETELKRLGVEVEFHIYEGAGHAFMDPTVPRYVEGATTDAWAKALRFMRRHMGVEAAVA